MGAQTISGKPARFAYSNLWRISDSSSFWKLTLPQPTKMMPAAWNSWLSGVDLLRSAVQLEMELFDVEVWRTQLLGHLDSLRA